jgi:hypothetical protein
METLQRTANRGSISTGYEVANSVKNEPDNGERFDTNTILTNYSSVRKFTVSGWFKRTELTVQSVIWFNVNTATSVQLEFGSDDKLVFLLEDNVGNGVESYAKTSALFRDTSAWYHVILAVDTTQGTAANRTKIYVNGVNQTLEQGNGSYDTFPAQNYDCPLQTRHYLLGYDGGNNGFRGYAAEYYFLDGITASPTDLGEFDEDSGIWKPIEYTGGFGNEGYYLNFEDASALGKDVSSNNQGNFIHYGGSAADQATDTPTNNFCTLNPLAAYAVQGGAPVISKGATYHNGSGGWTGMQGTMAVNKGKWYWELSMGGVGGGASVIYGIQTADAAVSTATSADNLLSTAAWYVNGAHWIKDSTSGRDDIASGDITHTPSNTVVYAAALNMDAGEITYYANGSVVGGSVGLSAVNLDGLVGLYVMPFATVYNQVLGWNFGGYTDLSISSAATDANGYGTFEYAPPSGYYALCTKNLAEFG